MSADAAPDFVIDAARRKGRFWLCWYRVVVLEASGELAVTDFMTLAAATAYANDAASEADGPGGSPYSYIFDRRMTFVGPGEHYAARGWRIPQ